MRRIVCAVCTFITLALLACFPDVMRGLPAPPEGLSALPYKGWSGVIQVWVCQSWRSGSGSFIPWLNGQFSAFEKGNQGIYIQVISVPQSRFEQMYEDGFARPDMVVYSPGELATVDRLVPLPAPIGDNAGIRAGLLSACTYDDTLYALPLALGAYGVLFNSEYMTGLPADWNAAITELYTPAARRQPARYALQLSGDPYYLEAAQNLLGNIPPASELLPPDYLDATYIKAQSDFKNGVAACIIGSQWNLRQLAILDINGKGFDRTFETPPSGWTNQLLAASIVNTGRADAAARISVCERLLKLLTSEKGQTALTSALAFPVLDDMSLYQGDAAMSQLEQSISGELRVPDVF